MYVCMYVCMFVFIYLFITIVGRYFILIFFIYLFIFSFHTHSVRWVCGPRRIGTEVRSPCGHTGVCGVDDRAYLQSAHWGPGSPAGLHHRHGELVCVLVRWRPHREQVHKPRGKTITVVLLVIRGSGLLKKKVLFLA